MRMSSGIFVRRIQEPEVFRVGRHPRGWCVTADDDLRPLSLHALQDDAVALAYALARRHARVVIVDADEAPQTKAS